MNINKGHNKRNHGRLQGPKDYAEYTALVREYAQLMPCGGSGEGGGRLHQPGCAGGVLKKNRAEAIKVSIYEYDERAAYASDERRGGYEEGYESGLAEGEKMVRIRS